MSVFDNPDFDDHAAVHFAADEASGLKAVIALHDLTLGPALGGCRMWAYGDETAAVSDVLRLSRGMTYKSALADLPYGGGKSVIIGDARTDKTPALFRAMGAAVERLGGRYIVAEDVGTTPDDMAQIARRTAHVKGVRGAGGDPSPATAWGVFHGLKAAVAHRLKTDTLAGSTVAVQGLGHVGMALARHLHQAGARLIVADIDRGAVDAAVAEFAAEAVAPERIHAAPADVFAPCALGGALNDETIPDLAARVVAGAANNQLAQARHAALLAERDILYAPDYLINAGGIIHIHHEGPDYDPDAAFAHVARIGATARAVFERAEADAITPADAADRMAEERIARARVRPVRAAVG